MNEEMFLRTVIIVLSLAMVASVIRIIIGPTVWDRLLGLSLVSSKTVIIIVIISSSVEQSYYLDLALVFAILGFVGTTSIASFFRKDK